MTSPPHSLVIYRRLLGYLVQHWRRFVVALLAMMAMAATEPLFAYLVKLLVDSGFVNRDDKMIVLMPFAIVVIFFVRGVANFVNEYTTTWLSSRLVSRVTYDVGQVAEAGFQVVPAVVKDGQCHCPCAAHLVDSIT